MLSVHSASTTATVSVRKDDMQSSQSMQSIQSRWTGPVEGTDRIHQVVKDDPEMMMRAVFVPIHRGQVFLVKTNRNGRHQIGMLSMGMAPIRIIADMAPENVEVLQELRSEMPFHTAGLSDIIRRFTHAPDIGSFEHIGHAIASTSDRGGRMIYDFRMVRDDQVDLISRTRNINRCTIVRMKLKAIAAMYQHEVVEMQTRGYVPVMHSDLFHFGRALNEIVAAMPPTPKEMADFVASPLTMNYTSITGSSRSIHIDSACLCAITRPNRCSSPPLCSTCPPTTVIEELNTMSTV